MIQLLNFQNFEISVKKKLKCYENNFIIEYLSKIYQEK